MSFSFILGNNFLYCSFDGIIDNVKYKSYSNELLINQTEFNINRNKVRSIANMRSAFDQNVYNKEYTLNGGVLPDSSILNMIKEINRGLTSGNMQNIDTLIEIAKKAQQEAINQN